MAHSGPVATDRAVGNGATAIDATTFKKGTVTAYCAVDNCSSAKDPPACASRVASNRTIDCRQRSSVIYATAPTATSHSVFANGSVLDRQCPAVVEMPPPKGGRNPTINAWLLFTVELTTVMVPTL